jgi:DNA-binding transcriptional MerR regulator
MRRRPQDAYRKELVRQLLENDVSVADIAMIMELPDSKKNLQIRLARL